MHVDSGTDRLLSLLRMMNRRHDFTELVRWQPLTSVLQIVQTIVLPKAIPFGHHMTKLLPK